MLGCHAPMPRGKGRPSWGEHKSLCINYEQSRQISAINYQNPRANCNLLQLLLLPLYAFRSMLFLPFSLSLSLSSSFYNACKHSHAHTHTEDYLPRGFAWVSRKNDTNNVIRPHPQHKAHTHSLTHPDTPTHTLPHTQPDTHALKHMSFVLS